MRSRVVTVMLISIALCAPSSTLAQVPPPCVPGATLAMPGRVSFGDVYVVAPDGTLGGDEYLGDGIIWDAGTFTPHLVPGGIVSGINSSYIVAGPRGPWFFSVYDRSISLVRTVNGMALPRDQRGQRLNSRHQVIGGTPGGFPAVYDIAADTMHVYGDLPFDLPPWPAPQSLFGRGINESAAFVADNFYSAWLHDQNGWHRLPGTDVDGIGNDGSAISHAGPNYYRTAPNGDVATLPAGMVTGIAPNGDFLFLSNSQDLYLYRSGAPQLLGKLCSYYPTVLNDGGEIAGHVYSCLCPAILARPGSRNFPWGPVNSTPFGSGWRYELNTEVRYITGGAGPDPGPRTPPEYFDPPTDSAFTYVSDDSTLFLSLCGLPSGFATAFAVSVAGIPLGTYGPNDTLVFADHAAQLGSRLVGGRGVRAFRIGGITPMVDGADPYCFPVALSFNTNRPRFSMYTGLALADVPSQVSEVGSVLAIQKASPNPARTTCTVAFSLAHDRSLQLSVFDATGRKMLESPPRSFAAGKRRWSVDLRSLNLSPGKYWVVLRGEGAAAHVPLTLTR